LHMFLSLSVVSLFVDLQIKPFRPNPRHSATGPVFPITVNIFSGHTVPGGEGVCQKTFSLGGSDPAHSGPVDGLWVILTAPYILI
jgi:hypothetical protein